jgi:hypothetical protein
MPWVTVHFSGDWTGVLPARKPGIRQVQAPPRTSIKDLIERVGVPHTEISRVDQGPPGALLDGSDTGSPVPLDMRVEGDCTLLVHPVPAVAATPAAEMPRFVVDVHLGGLATRLRLFGFDTAYDVDWEDAHLARVAVTEGRWLLTRDRGLLKRSVIRRGCLVRADRPDVQAREIVDRLGLRPLARPWSRCLRCGGSVQPVLKSVIEPRLLPRTRRFYETFRICADCAQIYWKGSHCESLRRMLVHAGLAEAPLGD